MRERKGKYFLTKQKLRYLVGLQLMKNPPILIKHGNMRILRLEKLASSDKDFDEMNKKKVWEIIKKEDIPKNQRSIMDL
jgi:hypothetical protein